MIHLSELRPCFYDDPIQIFMRRRLGFKETITNYISNAAIALKEFYYKNFEQGNIKHEETILPHNIETKNSFVYPLLLDHQYNVLIKADLLLQKSVIQEYFYKNIDSSGMMLVFFVSSPLSAFQKYKICATYLAVQGYNNIEKNKAILYYPSKKETEIISFSRFHDLIKPYISFVDWYNKAPTMNEDLSHEFMYPNMKYMEELSEDGLEWKTKWAYKHDEITLLPGVYPSHRKICKNMKELFESPKILDEMKIRGSKSSILKMLEMRYNNNELIWVGDKDKFWKTCLDWKRRHAYLYIDFETLDQKIYMIGIGHYDERQGFQYTCLVSKSESREDIQNLLNEFSMFLNEYPFTVDKIFYWYAETVFLKNAHGFDIGNVLEKYQWVDLCSIFRNNPVIIKDCFNYKLKNIWKWMKKYDMIDTQSPPNDCCNGGQSIEIAKQYFLTKNKEVLKVLTDYNEFDCRVMFDILFCIKQKFKFDK